jgi:ketosteroid isomerase-like protein
MSQGNVEIMRRAWEASERGDWESAFRDIAPNHELDWSRGRGPLLPGVHRGEEAQRLLIDFAESWQSIRSSRTSSSRKVSRCRAVDDAFRRARWIGVQARNTWTFTIRDGMIVRTCLYQDKQEALEAVGLSE